MKNIGLFPKFKVNKFPVFKPVRMSQIGEAEGGMGMFFGGVSRAELLKSSWYPVTYAGGGSAIGNIGFDTGALIDGVGELCQILVAAPEVFVHAKLVWFALRVISAAGGANMMNLRIDYDIGDNAEAYNTITGNFVHQATLTQNLHQWYSLDVPALAGLEGDHYAGIRCTYEGAGAGGIASNLYVLGIKLEWH